MRAGVAKRTFECSDCGHVWRVPHGSPRPAACPECEGTNIHRAAEDRSQGRDRSDGRRRGYRDGQPWEDE
jgi:predicted RNA-binding Zn-ribbon protein involved in translation (DUF1610 family)